MLRLLSIGIDCLSSVIFVIPAMVILRNVMLRQQGVRRWIAILLFALYLIAVFSVVGIPAVGAFKVDLRFNLIPLIDVVNSPIAYAINTVLNMILFLPLGFMVPAIWKDYRALKPTVLLGFALSVSIELMQIFTYRLTDIDDLITNTAGAAIGYCLSKRFSFQLPLNLAGNVENSKWYEPTIVIAMMLVITVFLKPIVSDGIWDLVLSSPWWKTVK